MFFFTKLATRWLSISFYRNHYYFAKSIRVNIRIIIFLLLLFSFDFFPCPFFPHVFEHNSTFESVFGVSWVEEHGPNQNSIENSKLHCISIIRLCVCVCVYFAQEISINWIKKITEASTIAMQTKTMGESCVFTSTIYINDFRCFSNTLSHGLHESDSTDPRIVWSGRKKSANKQINKNRKLNERKETKREWKKLWDNSTQILTAYKSFRCKNANKRSSYETENVVKMVKRRFNCWNVQIEPIIGLTSIHIPFLFAHAYPWSTSLFGQQFCLLII